MEILSCLCAGALLLQEPAHAPRPPKPDERRPAVALDPELRRAVDLLRATRGMRFELTTRAERDRPLQVEHERLDAFRLGGRVAWRAKGSEE